MLDKTRGVFGRNPNAINSFGIILTSDEGGVGKTHLLKKLIPLLPEWGYDIMHVDLDKNFVAVRRKDLSDG